MACLLAWLLAVRTHVSAQAECSQPAVAPHSDAACPGSLRIGVRSYGGHRAFPHAHIRLARCQPQSLALWAAPAPGAAAALAADGKEVVLAERFDSAGGLEGLGWRLEATPEQSEWRMAEGRLVAVCHRNPYNGGRITKPIPFLPRGVLEMDVLFAAEGGRNYGHLSLGFRLYGHMSSFKKYAGHQWLTYRPSEKRHDLVSNRIPLHRWVHLRMVFDVPAKRVEYFVGSDEDPVWVDTRFTVDAAPSEPELEFFNYGLTAGTVTHRVDNVVLRAQKDGVAGASAARDRLLLFEGISADRYRVAESVGRLFGAEGVSVFHVETRGAAIAPINQLALRSVPSTRRWREAALIILVDAPVGPGACVPGHVLESLVRAVRDGADLLVLGGPFAFGKGRYAGTSLEALLPVATDSRWAMRRFPAPARLRARAAAWVGGLGQEEWPTVLWYHDAPLTGDGVEVLLEAGGKPILVRSRAGRGTVTAFLGTTCGDFGDGKGGAVPFWEWSGWSGLVRRMVGRAESAREP